MKTYRTVSEAYLATLEDIYKNPDYMVAPRGLPIREKLDYTFKVLEPTSDPIVTRDLERNKVIADYTAKEMELYNSCSNKVEDFAKASKFWNQIANPDGTVNSAYGYLIWKNKSHGSHFNKHTVLIEGQFEDGEVGKFLVEENVMVTPWDWCVDSLKRDKDTRQAILRFSLPEHFWVGNKDMTCTLHGNWLIREDKLHLSVVMRSNDWNKGILYDAPWFCSLIDKMVDELKSTYPSLSKGNYTHTAHSAHIYEKDAQIVEKMLGFKL